MRAEMRRAAACQAACGGKRVLMLYNSLGQLRWEFPLVADLSLAFSRERTVRTSTRVIDFPGGGALIFKVMEPNNADRARGIDGLYSLQDSSVVRDPVWATLLSRLEEVDDGGQ